MTECDERASLRPLSVPAQLREPVGTLTNVTVNNLELGMTVAVCVAPLGAGAGWAAGCPWLHSWEWWGRIRGAGALLTQSRSVALAGARPSGWGWGWGCSHLLPIPAFQPWQQPRMSGSTERGDGRFSVLQGGEALCKQQVDRFCTAFGVLSHLRNRHKGQNH